MKRSLKKSTNFKINNENHIFYLLIILLLIIVFVYHCSNCNSNNNTNQSSDSLEGFQIKYSDKHLAGKKIRDNIPKGNPVLPRNQENITLVSCQGDFNKKKKSKSQKQKLYLDNNSDGIVLLPKGYIKVDLDNYEKVDSIIMKGLKNARIDISNKNNKNNNEFKHLFDINTKFCDDLLQYNKLNINQINHVSPPSDLEMKSIKITNISNKATKPIKLEILKSYNPSMKTNNNLNKINKKKNTRPQ